MFLRPCGGVFFPPRRWRRRRHRLRRASHLFGRGGPAPTWGGI